MPKKKGNLIGAWAFLIGVILAIVFAFFNVSTVWWIPWLMFVLGILIGLLNISDEESQPFLIAGAILVIITALGKAAFMDLAYVPSLLTHIMTLFVPATIVVAIKSVFSMAKA